MSDQDLDAKIADLEAMGFTVLRQRDDPDTQLRQFWNSATAALRMGADVARDGARLRLTTPFPHMSDDGIKSLVRSGVVRMVDAFLEHAVIEREGYADAAE